MQREKFQPQTGSVVIFDYFINPTSTGRKKGALAKLKLEFSLQLPLLALGCLIFVTGRTFFASKEKYPLFAGYFKRDITNCADYVFLVTSFTH